MRAVVVVFGERESERNGTGREGEAKAKAKAREAEAKGRRPKGAERDSEDLTDGRGVVGEQRVIRSQGRQLNGTRRSSVHVECVFLVPRKSGRSTNECRE